ncbi:MAG: type III secretion system chaperone [Burkholderiaceae bacterium]|nr:type III secretion system chaperone [Burkholderiaceae bacterium]
MTLPDLQYLVHQLGPATPQITTVIQEAIDSWMIEFDDGVSMQIAWDARSSRVLMKCAIGQPDEGTRESVYASLLGANLLLTGVADIKLALGETDDDVMLIGEYELMEATVDGLQHRLSEFLGYAGKFAQLIAGTFDGNAPDMGRVTSFKYHDQV